MNYSNNDFTNRNCHGIHVTVVIFDTTLTGDFLLNDSNYFAR